MAAVTTGMSSNGLNYEIREPEEEPPDSTSGSDANIVVLVHGVGNSMRGWRRVVEKMPSHFRVVRYDLRGHGKSEHITSQVSVDDFVDDHNALMSELGIIRYNLAGCSMGGLIAQGIAIAEPQRLHTLTLVSTMAHRDAFARHAVMSRFADLAAKGIESMSAPSASRWFTDQFRDENPELVNESMADYRKNDFYSYIASYRVLATADLGDKLIKITTPTVVLTGEHDAGSPPWMAHFMAARIPRARAVIVPGQKHQLLIEKPEIIADAMSQLVDRGATPIEQRLE